MSQGSPVAAETPVRGSLEKRASTYPGGMRHSPRGRAVERVARVHLFEPLGIHHFAWRCGPGLSSGQGNLLHPIVATLECP